MMRSLFLCFLLLSARAAVAFQFADGTAGVPAAGAAKYIFYWGQHQCDLTEANGFKAGWSVSPAAFRQLLLQQPGIWDGKQMVRGFDFKMDGRRISTQDYLSKLADLDASFGAKAVFGKVFHLTDLPLGSGCRGAIDISIIDPEEKDEPLPVRGSWSSSQPSLNEKMVERVVWGREDLNKISDRDFFTVSEFWQTVRQQPYVEWKSYETPQTISASVNFASPQQGTFGVVANLNEDDDYQQMLDNLLHYKHLAQPGAQVTLFLQTAERYEELYKKPMRLVPDNDPRLLLRRSRDTHFLRFQWGAIQIGLEGLYLSTYVDSLGRTRPVDETASRLGNIAYSDTAISEVLGTLPVCMVDEVPVPGFSFRTKIKDKYFQVTDQAAIDSATAKAAADNRVRQMELDSFELSGYALPPLSFTIQVWSFDPTTLVKNDFETLTRASTGFARAMFSTPEITSDTITVLFSIPREAFARISLFDSGGQQVYLIDDVFKTGQNSIRIPRQPISSKGKHYLFLNSPFGVIRQEIELD